MKIITGKILYGLLFILVIPGLLVLWAKYTAGQVSLPLPESIVPGYLLIACGAFLIISGMWALWRSGRGLPMNAFPPEKFVKTGIYAWMKHPIYSGASLISFGIAEVLNSSSGFWLVSPVFSLLMVAYVVGFENERTKIVFGEQDYKPFLSLPSASDSKPSVADRVSACILVYLPWLLIYELFIFIDTPRNPIITNFAFEKQIPVWEFTEVFYLSTYFFALAVPVIINTRTQLRTFITDIWFATITVGFIYFLLPFVSSWREFTPHSFWGSLLQFERSIDGEAAAFPSFHVIWAFISAFYFSKRLPGIKILLYLLAVLMSLSCITTGNHSIPDVVAGFLMFLVMINRKKIWDFIRLQAERLSNSWREWRWGPIRLINHGLYGGLSGFTGTLLIGFFLGQKYTLAGFIVMLFVIIGSGLWAQLIEGSPKLLRPYGYYGGLIGGIIACFLTSLLFSVNVFTILASCAMAGPWIQCIGRLRCLVQGCCHGRPSAESIGIRFTHPKSRVNKISGLAGIPLHPTQLYSIGTNILAGLLLIRFFAIGMPSTFIIGIYLIMNGTGRFVEESFRGEAQTPYWAGMRIYQWIALINIVAGAIVTTIPVKVPLSFSPNLLTLFLAVIIGVLVMIASGVDFPESNRRFARLTSE